jgi:spermidine synthase
MKSFELLGQALSPDGTVIQLMRRGDEFVILAGGAPLMSSRMHGSEDLLAAFGCRRAAAPRQSAAKHSPRILIGGLGMGYTLRVALDMLPPHATVVVAELIPEVVAWNHGPLAPLAGHPLADPRVRIEIIDVAALLSSSASSDRSRSRAPQTAQPAKSQFDAILLDVDNDPGAFTDSRNAALYSTAGIAAVSASLKPGGVFAVWSAREDSKFEHRLRAAKLTVQLERARSHANKGSRHTIYLAQKSER